MLEPCRSHLLPRSFLFTGRKAFLDARSVAPKLIGDTYWPEVFPLVANSAAATTNVSADATSPPIEERSTHSDSSAGSEPKWLNNSARASR
jgi:hypothetical protein